MLYHLRYSGVFSYSADLLRGFLICFFIVTTRIDSYHGVFVHLVFCLFWFGLVFVYWARFRSVLHKLNAFSLMSEFSIGLAPAREHKDIMVIGRLIRNHIVKLINSLSSESGPQGSIMTPKSLNHTGKGEEVPWLSGSAWRHFAFVRHNASGEIGGITESTGT